MVLYVARNLNSQRLHKKVLKRTRVCHGPHWLPTLGQTNKQKVFLLLRIVPVFFLNQTLLVKMQKITRELHQSRSHKCLWYLSCIKNISPWLLVLLTLSSPLQGASLYSIYHKHKKSSFFKQSFLHADQSYIYQVL